MKDTKKNLLSHIMNVITIALIIECFLCAMFLVNKFGKDHCFSRIEEVTHQVSRMFVHSMEQNQNNLTVFADILAANSSNPDDLLQSYMKNFCKTQNFDAVCIHRADGTAVYHGDHPHDEVQLPAFESEVARLPYVSQVYVDGDTPDQQFVYQAVPVIRSGKTIAVLYGYLCLDTFPDFISSTAYGGQGYFYIVDGDSGSFLMDQYRQTLGNLYEDKSEVKGYKKGYDLQSMRDGIRNGESGYCIIRARQTNEWYYTYYTPLGINNWSMQMTIDETTAFASHDEVNRMLMVLATCVILLMVIHILALMAQGRRSNQADRHNLHKSNYINEVQRTLINAHNTPDFVRHALKIIASEMQAETVLLLSFSGQTITGAQYWPSKDKAQAMNLVGRNIRDDFPTLYDLISTRESVVYDGSKASLDLSETAMAVFSDLDVSNVMLVPIMDNAGNMKGALAAVNSALKEKSCEMLECVTYDFFMALANQENLALIQRMGAMDYLTNIKNRNSYESELSGYSLLNSQSLWCIFVDVNGLHEVNNTQGHSAGDRMLCTVADSIKRIFGEDRTYRLGGDEFVAFATDSTQQDFQRWKHRITKELAARGYHVSIGYAGTGKNPQGLFDPEVIVAEAEAAMYHDKWEYYQAHSIPTDRGHFPTLVSKPEA